MSAIEETTVETTVMEIMFANDADMARNTEPEAYLTNEEEVRSHNIEAMRVDVDALNSFLELLYACDDQYIDTQVETEEYVGAYRPMLDWDSVSSALDESQRILVGVQQLLSNALAEMGVEDHEYIRVYSDEQGFLHLLADHEYKAQIEDILNSEYHRPLRELYHAATTGMSMAGGLVGRMSLPEAVVDIVNHQRAEAKKAEEEEKAKAEAVGAA